MDTRSTKVEPSRTRRLRPTVVEVDDESTIAARLKEKVRDTSNILETVHVGLEGEGESSKPTTKVQDNPQKQRRTKTKAVVRRDKSEQVDNKMPTISEKSFPQRHSSQEIRRDRFGDEDPLGINDMVWDEVKSQLEVLNNMEEFKPRNLAGLRKQWFEKCQDIMNGAPARLPPLREINHHIPIIDQNKRYMYHLPRCPDAIKPELMAKIERYTKAGWWK